MLIKSLRNGDIHVSACCFYPSARNKNVKSTLNNVFLDTALVSKSHYPSAMTMRWWA